MLPSYRTICPIAGHYQICIAIGAIVSNLCLKDQLHPQLSAAFLQDSQQPFARNSTETMTSRCDHAPLEMHINVIPVLEAGNDGFIRRSIGACKIVQRLIREDHAPAKGFSGPIALHDRNRRLWSHLLHQQRKIQHTRSYTNKHHKHKPQSLKLESTPHIDNLGKNILDVK